jgi:hypothetical protein
MHPSPRAFRFPAIVALLTAALALGGCVMNAGGGNPNDAAAASRTAPPPPDMATPDIPTPIADASGTPLIEQPASDEAVAAPAAEAPGKVDDSCTTDADCAVKDVGNCCGYYPACVNADSPTFPEQVKAECAKNDMQSVCGFRDIACCQCVEGRCSALDAGEGPVR